MLSALALSGCLANTKACPGFGSPLANKWNTGNAVGDVITYVNTTGSTIELELTAREDSKPYEGSSDSGSDVVNCMSSSDRQYNFENSDVVLRIEQTQSRLDNPATEELLNLSIEPESPAINAVAGYAYLFFLGVETRNRYEDTFDPNHSIELDPRNSRFIENLEIGENTYSYAIEQKFEDLDRITNVTDANSLATITRVILAEGGGLVQFELLNGEIYSRM